MEEYDDNTVGVIVSRDHDDSIEIHGVHRNKEIVEEALEAHAADTGGNVSIEARPRTVEGIVTVERIEDVLDEELDRIQKLIKKKAAEEDWNPGKTAATLNNFAQFRNRLKRRLTEDDTQ